MTTRILGLIIAIICVAFAASAGPAKDNDGDGVFDVVDNCSTLANAPPFDCDTDNDGYGNNCDGDFDQNFITSSNDFAKKWVPDFKKSFDSGTGTDMDCNGVVGSNDFSKKWVPDFKAIPNAPGPSGLYCAGTIPCDL